MHLHLFQIFKDAQPSNKSSKMDWGITNKTMMIGAPWSWEEGGLAVGPTKVLERSVKLRDFWGVDGKYRHLVELDGAMQPIQYLYDFGVSQLFGFSPCS